MDDLSWQVIGLSGAWRLVASSVQDLVALPVLWNDRFPGGGVVVFFCGRKAIYRPGPSESVASRGHFGIRRVCSTLARLKGNPMASMAMACRNEVAREGALGRPAYSAARRSLAASLRAEACSDQSLGFRGTARAARERNREVHTASSPGGARRPVTPPRCSCTSIRSNVWLNWRTQSSDAPIFELHRLGPSVRKRDQLRNVDVNNGHRNGGP